MSNHSGSYMLNRVIHTLQEFNVFTLIGKEKTKLLLKEIVKIGNHDDCNEHEIIDNFEEIYRLPIEPED